MPKLSFAVPHALEQEEVVQRLKQESDVLRSSFGDRIQNLEETWEDHSLTFRFTALGMSVDGRIAVEPGQVLTTANVPLAAMMFKSAIEEKVRGRLDELLNPSG
ncbi:MAG: polyhydroxyalkanoic acid system family protein [Pirellulales bacterium]|nr:polyhydroxyalkanoic acid system family protein [Pirellulales bacterium]